MQKLHHCIHKTLAEKPTALDNGKNVVLLHEEISPHTARITQKKDFGAWWVCSTPPTLFTWSCTWMMQNDLMGKSSLMKTRLKSSLKIFSTSKPAGFHSKELPDNWQQVIRNNGEYRIKCNCTWLFEEQSWPSLFFFFSSLQNMKKDLSKIFVFRKVFFRQQRI